MRPESINEMRHHQDQISAANSRMIELEWTEQEIVPGAEGLTPSERFEAVRYQLEQVVNPTPVEQPAFLGVKREAPAGRVEVVDDGGVHSYELMFSITSKPDVTAIYALWQLIRSRPIGNQYVNREHMLSTWFVADVNRHHGKALANIEWSLQAYMAASHVTVDQ